MTTAFTRALAAALAATTCAALTACGGNDDSKSGGGSTTAKGYKIPLSTVTPVTIPADSTKPLEGLTKAVVPGPESSIMTLQTSAPTHDSGQIMTSDGHKYVAPDGKEIVAVGWSSTNTDTLKGMGDYDGTLKINILDEGKTVATHDIDDTERADQSGGWLFPIPKHRGRVTVQIATNGGQQNVEAGTSQRNTATSNGLDPTRTYDIPLASAKRCVDPTPVKGDSASCLTVHAQLTDHTAAYGWAPPNHAWLIVTTLDEEAPMSPTSTTLATATLKAISGRLGSIPAKVNPGASGNDYVFPITGDTKPAEMTATVTANNNDAQKATLKIQATENTHPMAYGKLSE